ncbi:MAG: hypothetical protein F6K22_13735 [Okeania sp. SIO2F4]|uniref:hypothetical protein n=1 Tax=Okeania sp. SIO2F4 TaxID=2607790 RepID=UPI001429E8EC|nr:hypothetical protein [Okeania sp. SIO2F4]NES03806.1 hypothetical protein [Okeania sp. SIO2F4]
MEQFNCKWNSLTLRGYLPNTGTYSAKVYSSSAIFPYAYPMDNVHKCELVLGSPVYFQYMIEIPGAVPEAEGTFNLPEVTIEAGIDR